MMTGISISAIIPAYNAAPFIARAIESVLSQTYSAAEILVIDDGSTDNTFEIASSFGPPVRTLTKANGGPASARNLGIREAQGEWVGLLDADDVWLPPKLEEQIKFIEVDVGLIHSCARGMANHRSSDTTFGKLWRRNCILNSSVLLRREALKQVGGLDEDPALIGVEDYNLWLRIAASAWKIRSLSQELCLYTPAAGSLSSQILRFSAAELANARKISALLNLSDSELREKELSIFDEYGLELLHIRDVRNAREYFLEGLHRKPSLQRMLAFGATLLPKEILDLRRTIAMNFSRKRDRKMPQSSTGAET